MKRIGIVGANGQLGSEVCLFLSERADVQVVPICRNAIGAIFLNRCGLDVRIGSTQTPESSRSLLYDLDLIADFSLPAGSSSLVRSQIRNVIANVTCHAPDGIPFVYLSSILAFGNPDFRSPLKTYWFSQNAYGSTKRYGEHLAKRLSAKYRRPSYLFRVGVVHGELQAASRQAVKDLSATRNLTAYIPDCDSYTVFAFSVAEALVSVAYGKEPPGLYTLVSSPAWSWHDLHQYLSERAGVSQSTVLLRRERRVKSSGLARVKDLTFAALRGRKELLNGYVGAILPQLEQQMRATYHMRNAAAEITQSERARRYLPYCDQFDVYPGKRLTSLTDSRITMQEPARRLRERLTSLIFESPVEYSTR